jgi:hypothetical protein
MIEHNFTFEEARKLIEAEFEKMGELSIKDYEMVIE